MSEYVVSEIWSEIKRFISTVDRSEAAEAVVSILVDNDFDIDDIKEAFKGDSDIKRAIVAHAGNVEFDDSEEEDEEYADEDYSEEDDWEN